MDYYFNQLMEIQNSTDHSFFLLDQDSEPRFVIEADKRTIIIPAEFQFLGVKTDQRSEKIYFEVDRIFDDIDLSTKTCVIQYINAGTDDVDEGIYPVTELDTTTVPGKIVFKWEVDNIVCKYAGVVAFSVRFYEIDPETKLYTYCWNTIPESLPVLDGLNVSGSVTEDFPTELLEWNARMAALNTEITNKISTADATMKADLKTAKGYMDGAQTARAGAEEAESRVNKIVAGNEAYTKVESDTMYAKSQIKESERGTSVEISPEDGSNLTVTAYGFTEQAGSGDPSPTNVRALTNGGLKLVQLMLTGSEQFYFNGDWSAGDFAAAYMRPPSQANASGQSYCNQLQKNTNASPQTQKGFVLQENAVYIVLPKNDLVSQDSAGIKAWLAARYTAGDPVIVWYQPASESDATGLYAPIILEGGEYRATCLPLTAPLCEGDSVVSWVRSGCDVEVMIDGTENFLVDPASTFADVIRFSIQLSDADTSSPVVFSERFTPSTVFTLNSEYIGITDIGKLIGAVYKSRLSSQDAEGVKAYFAAHPLTVWYRSTNYTEADDIAVSLETHVQAVLVPASGMGQTGGSTLYFKLSNLKPITYPKCSHVPSKSPYSEPSGVYCGADGITLTFKIDGFTSMGEYNEYFAEQATAGTPVTIVYQLATPITYAHPAIDVISNITNNGSVLISGQKEISVTYHKSLDKTIVELDKTIVELDNKSYSKQESHNIFARALRGTAEESKSITIHPDAGSNVVATAHGFTKQEGSGDASPANIRKILVGGRKLLEVTLTGSEPNVYRTEGNKTDRDYFYQIRLDNNSQVGNFIPMSGNWSTKSVSNKFGSGNPYSTSGNVACSGKQDINVFNEIRIGFKNDPGSVDAFKKIVKKYYDDGDPIKVWCPLEDETKATALFAAVTATSVGACSKLTAPLCQGDTLITKVKSGCDKKLILDGSLNWSSNSANSPGSNSYAIYLNTSEMEKLKIPAKAFGYSEQYIWSNGYYSSDYPSIYAESVFAIRISAKVLAVYGYDGTHATGLEACKKYLNDNPQPIWFRSTEYDSSDGFELSSENHVRWKYTFNGTESWTVGGVGAYLSSGYLPGNKTATSGKCSHFKYQYSYTENTIMVETSGRVALGTAAISELGFSGVEDWKAYLAEQYAAGNPVEVEYELSAPITYAHEPVDLIASPDEDGALVITGETDGTVSAEYNKDITYAFNELQSALLAAIAKLSL